jgi:hypothetical protein
MLLVAVAAATAVGSLAFGSLAGFSIARSIPLGFYFVGAFFVLIGFFFGNRGPVRLKGDGGAQWFGPRLVRWATPDERLSSIADSAIFVVLGIALIFIGLAADTRQGVW